MSKLLLIEHMQHMRLILLKINSTAQPALTANRIVIHTHIMSRCQVLCIQRQCPIEQQGKADMAVTRQAWIRRSSRHILGIEVIYHVLLELLLDVHEIKRYIEPTCNTP